MTVRKLILRARQLFLSFIGEGQPAKSRGATRTRLGFEVLEGRDVPAIIVVNDTRDTPLAAIPLVQVQGQPPTQAYMTLRAAIDKSEITPGPDTITFDPTVTNPASGSGGMMWLHVGSQLIKAMGGEEVTIIGPGATSLGIQADATAANKFRVMSMSGGKLSVSGLAFQGGWSSVNGGAIQIFGGEATFQNCEFYNNNADGHGGAIAHAPAAGAGNPPDVGDLTILNCFFSNNHALTAGGSNGGAIFSGAKFSTLRVEGSTLRDNSAGEYGGAIAFASANNQKQVIVKASTANPMLFLSNEAQKGGAFGLVGNSVQIQISDSTFAENRGTITAGGIYLSGGTTSYLTCLSSTFINNVVTNLGTSGTPTGGAVELDCQSATFGGCNFTGNAAKYGGALFVKLASVVVYSTSFQSNYNNTPGLGPNVCYAGVLDQNVHFYILDQSLTNDDLVAYIPPP